MSSRRTTGSTTRSRVAACGLAAEVGAAAIVTPTLSGRRRGWWPGTGRGRGSWPSAPTDAVLRRLALVWGIAGVRMSPVAPGGDRLATAVARRLPRRERSPPGERVVVLAGHPIEGGPRFPTVRVVRVGAGGDSEEP